MRKILATAGLVLVLVSLMVPGWANAQAQEPAATVEAFIAAFNAYDAAAATALVTDDFELKIVAGTPDDPVISGKEGLTEMLGGVQEDNFQLTVSDLKTEGTRVTGNYSGDGDQIRAVGIGPEVGTIDAQVENELVKSIAFIIDPEYNARSEAAMAAQETLPQTGTAPVSPLWAGLVVGLGLLALGFGLWVKNKKAV